MLFVNHHLLRRERRHHATIVIAVSKITAGDSHTCAINTQSQLKCWGEEENGRLGTGVRVDGKTPQFVDVGSKRRASSISAGSQHTCAVIDDGSLKCWGLGELGQLGQGNTSNYPTPQTVNLGFGRKSLAVTAGNGHTCAILDNFALKCWGANGHGQLGLGHQKTLGDNANEMGDNLSFLDFGKDKKITAVSAGGRHTCAILDDGLLRCWGQGESGQLGLGHSFNHPTPQIVHLGTGRKAKVVKARDHHTCTILDNGTLTCWGSSGPSRLERVRSVAHYHPQNNPSE